jgi:hypothetical protein
MSSGAWDRDVRFANLSCDEQLLFWQYPAMMFQKAWFLNRDNAIAIMKG